MATRTAPYTKDEIKALLMTSDKAVERAILAIYARQTQEEKNARTTNRHNAVGFSQAHVRFGSWCAGLIQRELRMGKVEGTILRPDTLAKARRFMTKYSRQLAEVANAKLAATQVPPAAEI